MTPNKIIAVTGGIGSGKSLFCSIMASFNYDIIDCDKLAREVASDFGALEKIKQVFGERFVVNGALDRKALREEVFKSEQKKKALDDIFFAPTVQRLKQKLKESLTPVVFVEVSNYNAQMRSLFTLIFRVEAAENIRLNRVTHRDGAKEENIKDIMALQQTSLEVDEIIINEGDLNSLTAQAKALIKKYNL